ncbi:SprT family zinc-dependent metalloprotease [Solemya elarraichensis gill symbiont]|uniref:SprT family zinc-dependent metalloprotease n=1 Tax=Solemya elarraichensis gill symbiont TaxID=1918949 RepID=UPI002481B938|nr:SprT-like domain-containing protein [Solemya elarraichensis gill symbiont]
MSQNRREQVRHKVAECLELAANHFDKSFELPEIRFDLHARAAGQYRYGKNLQQLRFNPYLFATAFDENLDTTVPHEVAHYVTFNLFGRVKPHGREWREVMKLFGVPAEVTHNQKIKIPGLRRERRWGYQCGCQTHQLTTRRHNKVISGKGSFSCRKCGQLLRQMAC